MLLKLFTIVDIFSFLSRQARAGIREVHFLPSNSVDKRTALTYVDSNGDWHRASKGSLEQVCHLVTFLCSSYGDPGDFNVEEQYFTRVLSLKSDCEPMQLRRRCYEEGPRRG